MFSVFILLMRVQKENRKFFFFFLENSLIKSKIIKLENLQVIKTRSIESLLEPFSLSAVFCPVNLS